MEYFSTNSVKKLFADYVANEPNLQGYYFGQPYDINGQTTIQQVYPGMLVTPTQTIVGEIAIQRQYQIIIYDILNFEKSNEIEIISDAEEFAFRLIRFLRSASEGFYTIGDPIVTPFVDKFLDDVAGVLIDVTIDFNGDNNDCYSPNVNFTPQSINI